MHLSRAAKRSQQRAMEGQLRRVLPTPLQNAIQIGALQAELRSLHARLSKLEKGDEPTRSEGGVILPT